MKLINRLIILFFLALATGAHAETVAIATSHPDTAIVLTSADGNYTSSSGTFNSFYPFGGSRMLVQKKAFIVLDIDKGTMVDFPPCPRKSPPESQRSRTAEPS